jgi:DNA-binding MarR family transcriptional regulator
MEIYKELMEDKGLSLTAKAVYVYISEIGANIKVSKMEIAKELNVNRNTIIKSYKELVQAGYIEEYRSSVNQASIVRLLK